MKDSNVIVLDTFSNNSSHEIFNTSLVLICSYIFKDVRLYVGSDSIKCFRYLLNNRFPDNVSFKEVNVLNGRKGLGLLFRYLYSSLSSLYFLIILPKNYIYIFPQNNLFSLRLINAINKILKKNILIFCHGELEFLSDQFNESGFFYRIFSFLMRNFFKNKNIRISKNIYFSVLGDVILNNLFNILDDSKRAHFISVDHPYIFDSNLIVRESNSKLNVGTIGFLNKLKGESEFFKFCNIIKSKFYDKISVNVFGSSNYNVQNLLGAHVNVVSTDGRLFSRHEYDLYISSLDYIIFFYSLNNYQLTASGAVFDAIRFDKPIVALANPYFKYLFQKFGSFGYLFDSIEDMAIKVETLSIGVDSVQFDFKSIKFNLSPFSISNQLEVKLREIKFLK